MSNIENNFHHINTNEFTPTYSSNYSSPLPPVEPNYVSNGRPFTLDEFGLNEYELGVHSNYPLDSPQTRATIDYILRARHVMELYNYRNNPARIRNAIPDYASLLRTSNLTQAQLDEVSRAFTHFNTGETPSPWSPTTTLEQPMLTPSPDQTLIVNPNPGLPSDRSLFDFLTPEQLKIAEVNEIDKLHRRINNVNRSVKSDSIHTAISFIAPSGTKHHTVDLLLNMNTIRGDLDFTKVFSGVRLLGKQIPNSYSYQGKYSQGKEDREYIVNIILCNNTTLSYMYRFISLKPSFYIYKRIFKVALGMDLDHQGLWVDMPVLGETKRIMLSRELVIILRIIGLYEPNTLRAQRTQDFFPIFAGSRFITRSMFQETEDVSTVDPMFINESIYQNFLTYVNTIRGNITDQYDDNPETAKQRGISIAKANFPFVKDFIKNQEDKIRLENMLKNKLMNATSINDSVALADFMQRYKSTFKTEQDYVQTVLSSNPSNLMRKTNEFIKSTFKDLLAPVPMAAAA